MVERRIPIANTSIEIVINDDDADEVRELKERVEKIIAPVSIAPVPKDIGEAKVKTFGRKGVITNFFQRIKEFPPDKRKDWATSANTFKEVIAHGYAELEEVSKERELEARLAGEKVDVTLPVRPEASGTIHPVSQAMDEIVAIFADMGFDVAEGPDIESDYYNFTALNFPEGHPAREMHDTFYLREEAGGERKLLRTHTSPVQVRTMLSRKPPLRVIVPGRTYRCDSDQTHTPMFHQVEGLLIDRESHLGHLKWVLEEFAKAYFEVDNVVMRFRPSYFPFTEPSAEVDIGCDRSGSELKIGEGKDWLEILGCGMVHPNVLRNVGLNPDEWQGWAFGMGIDRVAMLKYGIPDLRDFFAADLRWLKHYGFTALDIPNLATGLSR